MPLQGGAGLLQVVFRVVELAAVVAGHQEVAHGFGVVVGQNVADGEVAEGLGHLLLVHHHHAAVHPGVDVVAAVGATGLGYFVLVVGNCEIGAAAVDVEVVAKVLGVHGGALDVPAGATRAPGLSQVGSPGLDIFHSTKSRGSSWHPTTSAGHRPATAPDPGGELAVVGVESTMNMTSPLSAVGVLFIQQGCTSSMISPMCWVARGSTSAHHAEGVEVGVRMSPMGARWIVTGRVRFGGALDDLVVHVGDVAHIVQLVAAVAQVKRATTSKRRRCDRGRYDGDHGDSDATHTLRTHLAGWMGFEFFFLTSECVVYLRHLMTTACE